MEAQGEARPTGYMMPELTNGREREVSIDTETLWSPTSGKV